MLFPSFNACFLWKQAKSLLKHYQLAPPTKAHSKALVRTFPLTIALRRVQSLLWKRSGERRQRRSIRHKGAEEKQSVAGRKVRHVKDRCGDGSESSVPFHSKSQADLPDSKSKRSCAFHFKHVVWRLVRKATADFIACHLPHFRMGEEWGKPLEEKLVFGHYFLILIPPCL